jgi:pimeloyl-ACP methyl ester carboxylesterase
VSTTGDSTLQVSGATLYYRVRGAGPLLLILPGGHGDADAADALCERLADRYTVVTYDRRGQSRSPIDPAAGMPSIETHAADAHALLAALTNEPALVFGSSFGGLVGLDLLARHPKLVRVLVAHEPPAWDLLPEQEADRARQGLESMVRTFRERGLLPAFQKLADLTATDLTDREDGVALQQPTPRIAANLKFFFNQEVIGVNRYRLDPCALEQAGPRIVPAAAGSVGKAAPYKCAVALADRLGTTLEEFPGGHTGWLLRPKAFAVRLAEVLGQHSAV